MVAVKMSITVCDVCQDPDKGTSPYEIKVEGKRTKLDLCDEHAKPIDDLLPSEDRPQRSRVPRRQPTARKQAAPRSSRKTTVEAIEASK